jgi:hypothetical protein
MVEKLTIIQEKELKEFITKEIKLFLKEDKHLIKEGREELIEKAAEETWHIVLEIWNDPELLLTIKEDAKLLTKSEALKTVMYVLFGGAVLYFSLLTMYKLYQLFKQSPEKFKKLIKAAMIIKKGGPGIFERLYGLGIKVNSEVLAQVMEAKKSNKLEINESLYRQLITIGSLVNAMDIVADVRSIPGVVDASIVTDTELRVKYDTRKVQVKALDKLVHKLDSSLVESKVKGLTRMLEKYSGKKVILETITEDEEVEPGDFLKLIDGQKVWVVNYSGGSGYIVTDDKDALEKYGKELENVPKGPRSSRTEEGHGFHEIDETDGYTWTIQENQIYNIVLKTDVLVESKTNNKTMIKEAEDKKELEPVLSDNAQKIVDVMEKSFKDYTLVELRSQGTNLFDLLVDFELEDSIQKDLELKRYLIASNLATLRQNLNIELSEELPVVNVRVGSYEFVKGSDNVRIKITILLNNTAIKDWVTGSKPAKIEKDK